MRTDTTRSRLFHEDVFTVRGYSFRVEFEHDDQSGPPWEDCDGHGIVSDWTSRKKGPGEKVLIQDRGSFRYYDIAGTMKIAIRDGWNAKPYEVPGETKKQRAARAVQADYEYLRAWCHDEWEYLVVIVTALDEDGNETDDREVLGSVESSDPRYLTDTAYELADQIITEHLEVPDPDIVPGDN